MARHITKITIAGICLFIVGLWIGGSVLIAPHRVRIGAPPADLRAESVLIHSDTGSEIKGWFIRGAVHKGAVLLLHGVRANRLSLIPRARLFASQGYSVLLIDLQAHGESSGDAITFGYRESHDAAAAVQFLRDKLPGEKIGAIGMSLGGAALLLADPPLPIDAMIVESVYPTIEAAAENRLRVRIGPVASLISPLLFWQLPIRLGISTADLRPIDHVSGQHPPLFIISGAEDRHTTLAESQELYSRASQPKQFWWVEGAQHVDLYNFDRYSERVTEFFLKYLRVPATESKSN